MASAGLHMEVICSWEHICQRGCRTGAEVKIARHSSASRLTQRRRAARCCPAGMSLAFPPLCLCFQEETKHFSKLCVCYFTLLANSILIQVFLHKVCPIFRPLPELPSGEQVLGRHLSILLLLSLCRREVVESSTPGGSQETFRYYTKGHGLVWK